jgi:hypothetical protein
MQALNNSSSPLRLSQFFLHTAAETFGADDSAFMQAAHGQAGLQAAGHFSHLNLCRSLLK